MGSVSSISLGEAGFKSYKRNVHLQVFLQGLAGMVLFWNLTDLGSFFSVTLGKLSQKFPLGALLYL
jgi:hypothetical protein